MARRDCTIPIISDRIREQEQWQCIIWNSKWDLYYDDCIATSADLR
jgi:hypothetical protein